MPDKYWFVTENNIAREIFEVSAEEMSAVKNSPKISEVVSYPFMFAEGMGIWPNPPSGCRILKEITQDEI